MKVKKVLSIIATIAMLCSLFAVSVAAGEETLCAKVGIASDLSATKIIKYDGTQFQDAPNLNTNYQVINLGDKLGVFSLSYYKVTGKSLCALLLGQTNLKFDAAETLTSTGYKLEYYTPAGIKDESAAVENGGTLRATKDDDVVNIPIVDSVHLISGGIGAFNTGGTTMKNLKGLGGKAFDDESYQIAVPPLTNISTARARAVNINSKNTPLTMITAEFQLRITGDVKVNVYNNNGNSSVFSYDGTLSKRTYPNTSGALTSHTVCDDASLWHNVAVEFNYPDNRVYWYYDGVKVAGDAGLCNSAITELRFEINGSNFAEGGTVEIDNLIIHRGAYTGRGITVSKKSASDNVGIDTTAKKIYYKGDSLTKADLAAALAEITDASDIKLYADTTLAEAAPDTIADGNAAVLTTASGTHCETYIAEKKSDNEIIISSDGADIKAYTVYNYGAGQLLIAEYNASGTKLLGVKPATDFTGVTIADKTADGNIYKAFLWDSVTTADPILPSCSYPSK